MWHRTSDPPTGCGGLDCAGCHEPYKNNLKYLNKILAKVSKLSYINNNMKYLTEHLYKLLNDLTAEFNFQGEVDGLDKRPALRVRGELSRRLHTGQFRPSDAEFANQVYVDMGKLAPELGEPYDKARMRVLSNKIVNFLKTVGYYKQTEGNK